MFNVLGNINSFDINHMQQLFSNPTNRYCDAYSRAMLKVLSSTRNPVSRTPIANKCIQKTSCIQVMWQSNQYYLRTSGAGTIIIIWAEFIVTLLQKVASKNGKQECIPFPTFYVTISNRRLKDKLAMSIQTILCSCKQVVRW